jgi:hypothetical protein
MPRVTRLPWQERCLVIWALTEVLGQVRQDFLCIKDFLLGEFLHVVSDRTMTKVFWHTGSIHVVLCTPESVMLISCADI